MRSKYHSNHIMLPLLKRAIKSSFIRIFYFW
jgi:hypothetical protein